MHGYVVTSCAKCIQITLESVRETHWSRNAEVVLAERNSVNVAVECIDESEEETRDTESPRDDCPSQRQPPKEPLSTISTLKDARRYRR